MGGVPYERGTHIASGEIGRLVRVETTHYMDTLHNPCILVYLLIYDSGKVSLEHLLLSWYPPRKRFCTREGINNRCIEHLNASKRDNVAHVGCWCNVVHVVQIVGRWVVGVGCHNTQQSLG